MGREEEGGQHKHIHTYTETVSRALFSVFLKNLDFQFRPVVLCTDTSGAVDG